MNRDRQKGFTLVEMAVAIAIIGVLALFAVPHFIHNFQKTKSTLVMDQMRDLQTVAMAYVVEKGVAPTLEQLDKDYARGGRESIIGKYIIVSMRNPAAGSLNAAIQPGGGGAAPGVAAQYYVICSTMKLADAEYIYAADDKKVSVAEKGANPIGVAACGDGRSGGSGGGNHGDPNNNYNNGGGGNANNGNGNGNNNGGGNSNNNNGNSGGNGNNNNGGGDNDDPNNGDNGRGDTHNDNGIGDGRDRCNINTQCPCDGDWKNHGQFEKCVNDAAKLCYEDGKISKDEKKQIHDAASHSNCGKDGSHGESCGD